ncbi:hypothetical protein N0V93_006546 [Gnomoniopsis smithogilvyi]|uniref:C2H2-type domain-containing protein n=1 Tax=Gnomoniopsis smithogilvyi TaxID=1191159 RepID=A0A9W8YPK3_9PEZI|nr:hypothetical protein N0V93_006546 [Gnomoniopsis smithogilvyi]
MESHDDVEMFPRLPHLLGISLYTELFSDQSICQSDNTKIRNQSQVSDDLPFPLDIDINILPSDYQHVCQQSQRKGDWNPQTFHELSVLQFGLHRDNFQSFQAMTCPLNTDAYPEPVFNCDCGEEFDNLESMVSHRESDLQHKPWHGIWEGQDKGICLCGRPFNDEAALRRHIRLAKDSRRRQRWVDGQKRNKQLQIRGLPMQNNHRPCSAIKSRGLEEAARLQQHVEDINKLIVEGTIRQLIEEKDGIDKAEWQVTGKMSQKQRKQLMKEKAKKSADQSMGSKP